MIAERPVLLAALLVALSAAAPPAPLFIEAAAETGLSFTHTNGASGRYYMPELLGSGVALIDYDNDGDLDVFLVQGGSLGEAPLDGPTSRLFRNDLTVGPDGRRYLHFTDVTAQAGVGLRAYGMGAAVGDYDNDGHLDLFVTAFGNDTLFHNNGDGSFSDVTAAAGVSDPLWSTSAAFLDYDRDGDLDLFVANYLDYTIAGNKSCTDATGARDYCGPRAYPSAPDRLYRNDGHGRFTNVTETAGIARAGGAGLGVAVGDYNGDGWLDLYVANDATPNQLWINRHDGTFTDEGPISGAALNSAGNPEGSMGIASGDPDGDGDEDLLVTNIAGESFVLYRNDGLGNFEDVRTRAGVGAPTSGLTGFGAGWLDYDNDGWLDAFAANGAVNTIAAQRGTPSPFRMRNLLLHNDGGGRFADVTPAAYPALERAGIGRGAAFGDLDNDGDTDIVVTNNGGPVRLLLNAAPPSRWLDVTVARGDSSVVAVGTRVGIARPGAPTQWRRVGTDGSYLSASDLRVHFGLGQYAGPVTLLLQPVAGPTIRWPVAATNRRITVQIRSPGGPSSSIRPDPLTLRSFRLERMYTSRHRALPVLPHQGAVSFVPKEEPLRELSNMTSGRKFWSGVRVITASFALLAIGLMAAPVHAQILYGSIVGVVQDAQGSSIPAASVTVVNTGTNLTQETVSNANGEYTITNLQPGTYDVKVGLQGFREFVKTGVPVTAGQISRVAAKLEIGALTETVTVQSAAQLLQTDKSDLHTELKSKEIINLPLNQYRNYQALINLVPGATPASFQNSQVDTPGRSLRTNVNGMDGQSNNTRIDGASSVNIWLPHHAGYVAPAETIDTVNIATNNFDAASGMAGGAAITLVTKSGTNTLKGSAFYFRNQDELNSKAFFDPSKLNSSVSIGGGTIGGPIVKSKLFYFAGFETNRERNSRFDTYTVPTAKMRNGDFSEVLAVNPNFKLYDPATGNADGTGRTQFPGAVIPGGRLSGLAQQIQGYYPTPNNAGTNNGLQNNLYLARLPVALRDNYDVKVNWNRTTSHQLFAKFSTMQATVDDLFYLGVPEVGSGDTKVYVATVGNTWTLSPTMVLDGNIGMNKQNQTAQGGDFGTNIGSETFGLKGTNGPDPRQSGLPYFETGLSTLGNNATWTPLERHETSYTATTNLTKLFGAHELRTGFDFIRYQMNHWQPELGSGPRGNFGFSGNLTGTPGYNSTSWNRYAGFLLGLDTSYGKSIQYEEMSGRENQYGLFINDRWNASDKLTLNLGLRYEYYPLMSRENRGIEVLDLQTFNVLLGGVGSNSKDLGIKVSKTLFAPRLGAAYRLNDKTVFRAGYGQTFDPIPWSRPLRGFYPLTIGYANSVTNNFDSFQLASGIPTIPLPDLSTGVVPLPPNTTMRWPDPTNVDRGRTQQYNVAIERQLPAEISASVAYVGTRMDGGYADHNLNYSEPGGGNSGRQYFAQAGTADVLQWGSFTKRRYNALQVAINRPFKGGLLLKGAYTLSKARNETDDDGWVGLSWNQPSQMYRNFALAGYDRTHNFQMGFLYDIPLGKGSTNPVALLVRDWQLNGVFAAYSGTPFTIGGDNTLLNQRGGTQTIDLIAPLKRVGNPGPNAVYYDPASFAQPGNKWGNTGRNQFRGPSTYNLDMGLFRGFPIGHYRVEFRATASNVLNHSRWNNPITNFTDPNFMKIRSVQDPRKIQLGVRFQF